MSNESREERPGAVRVHNILERYEKDTRLLERARADRKAWERLRDILISSTNPMIRSWIASGQMWSEAMRVGVPAPYSVPFPPEPGDIASLASEVIVRACRRFERHGLHTWSPAVGMSLHAWFVNDCKHQFANAVRAWSKDRRGLTPGHDCALGVDSTNLDAIPHRPAFGNDSTTTPEAAVVERMEVERQLGQIEGELGRQARQVFEQRCLHERSFADISRELKISAYMANKIYQNGLEVLRNLSGKE
jgi:DNA-directed RNA polymerase specialized sigma24 family protein